MLRLYYIIVTIFYLPLIPVHAGPVIFELNGYSEITVGIDSRIPSEDCFRVLNDIKFAFEDASATLFTALNNKAFFKNIVVMLPDTWPEKCYKNLGSIHPTSGETVDIIVGLSHPIFGDIPWTKHFRRCSEPGEMIYLSHKRLENRKNLGRLITQQWVKYRYGVFEEAGFPDDPIYPMCYPTDTGFQVTGCSNKPIETGNICSNKPSSYDINSLVNYNATSSLMFAPGATPITKFCGESTHNRYAPTKQNAICNRRSIMNVISHHKDFNPSVSMSELPAHTAPTFTYKKSSTTRYVVLIEESLDMAMRDSWPFVRNTLRIWLLEFLPNKTEVSVVLMKNSATTILRNLTAFKDFDEKDHFASSIPHTADPFQGGTSMAHGFEVAFQMLKLAVESRGEGTSIILLIAPGMSNLVNVSELIKEANSNKVKLITINYPAVIHGKPLNELSEKTSGISYTVLEKRVNSAASHISTFFSLTRVLKEITDRYRQEKLQPTSIQIHYREITDKLGKNATGSFVLDKEFKGQINIALLFQSLTNPMIRKITLVSPQGKSYNTQSDKYYNLHCLVMKVNSPEYGRWRYIVERDPGNSTPHLLQIMATPVSIHVPVIEARAWINALKIPFIIYVEVMRGDFPVLRARVQVFVTQSNMTGGVMSNDTFDLYDNGSGDPDVTQGDGIYSRYFRPDETWSYVYTFHIAVTDNGDIKRPALTWQENYSHIYFQNVPCCGSNITAKVTQNLPEFQRILAPISVVTRIENFYRRYSYGRIGDLSVTISEMKAVLKWTTPDMGGFEVKFYELRYSTNITEIVDRFNYCKEWEEKPLPLSPGSENNFSLNFNKSALIGKKLFFVLRATPNMDNYDSSFDTLSNWVQVYVPSPPPPAPWSSPTPAPIYNFTDYDSVTTVDETIQNNSGFPIFEIIIPACLVGLIVLLSCVVCFCFLRRRTRPTQNEGDISMDERKDDEKPPSSSNAEGISPQLSLTASNNGDRHVSPENCNFHRSFDIALSGSGKSTHSNSNSSKTSTEMHQNEQQMQHENLQHYGRISNIVPHLNGKLNSTSNNDDTRLSPFESWPISNLLRDYEKKKTEKDKPFAPSNSGALQYNIKTPNIYGAVRESYDLYKPVHENNEIHSPPVAFNLQHPHMYVSKSPYGVHPNAFMNGKYTTDMLITPGNNISERPAKNHAMQGPFSAIRISPKSFVMQGQLPPLTISPKNQSLQGSMSSVSSADKKRRAVTMV